MEITIYELMGLIKNDKAPKKIKYDDVIYTLNFGRYYSNVKMNYLFDLFNRNFMDIDIPNLKVEILPEENEMKEMVYQKDRKIEILYHGFYKDYEFYIINLGTHPTAYVNVINNNLLAMKDYDDIDISVHGGLTYSENHLCINEAKEKVNGWFIGWDYAHYNDYAGYEMNMPEEIRSNGKKWTTEEIYEDVKDVIKQCINYEENDEWENIEEYDLKPDDWSTPTQADIEIQKRLNVVIKNQKYLKAMVESLRRPFTDEIRVDIHKWIVDPKKEKLESKDD